MTSGEAIYQVVLFYIKILGQLLNLMNSFEILPGISFLGLIITVIVIAIIFKLIRGGLPSYEVSAIYDGNTNELIGSSSVRRQRNILTRRTKKTIIKKSNKEVKSK